MAGVKGEEVALRQRLWESSWDRNNLSPFDLDHERTASMIRCFDAAITQTYVLYR